MTSRRHPAVAQLFLIPAAILLAVSQGWAQAPAAGSAKTWVDQAPQIEDYLRSAEIVSMQELGVGVTRPKRAKLAPGGLVESLVWKPVKPGRYSGYWESYKSEIAAYELDKLLGLGMTPPTVEKRHQGELGAAIMWVAPTKSFKDLGGVPGQKNVAGPPGPKVAAWVGQLTRAKMFDNLIGNLDPNLGNWLVDPEWNLIVIDRTRAFTSSNKLYHELLNVDNDLWNKMKALDEPGLTAALGKWLDESAIKGILQRRAKMQEAIDKLAAKRP